MQGFLVDEECLNAGSYQKAMDSGFRRSGNVIYRPVYALTCCPLQSIRLDARKFDMKRSQRNVLVKFLKFIGYPDCSQYSRQELVDKESVNVIQNGGYGRLSYSTDPRDFSIEEAFHVWKRYQIAIHGDDENELTVEHFKSSFVESPLLERTVQAQMRIDGRLVGVSVLDLASSCVSSVYFY